jgi:hypothetical protein
MQVLHTHPRFVNSVFMVPEKGGKWRKVVDCRMVSGQLIFVHFRMNDPDVVQLIALPGDWATSLDIKSAFNHMRVREEFRPFLCFEQREKYYAYNSMPFGCCHSPRVFARALSYAMAYIRVHWELRIVTYMDDILLLHQHMRIWNSQLCRLLSTCGVWVGPSQGRSASLHPHSS